RRRHTRFSRDWSSDVCSSDLSRRASGARQRTFPEKSVCVSSFCCRVAAEPRLSAAGGEKEAPVAPGTKVVQRLASLFVRDDAIKDDVMLKFFLDITGTDYLHFGMWEPGDPLELEYLQAAQERYAEHLLSLIPKGVRSILDVGCGVGGNARKMAERGY